MASPNDLFRDDWDRSAGMDDFRPESNKSGWEADEPLLADEQVPATVSLQQLKTSGVVATTNEAVAIVEALCRSIIDGGDQVGPANLDAGRVFVHATGAVTAASDGRRDAQAAVEAVGRLLSDLLPEHDILFLRERVVSRALSATTYFSSLEEFLHALEFYAQPNRGELVRGVYLRWRESLSRPSATPEETPEPQWAPAAIEPRPARKMDPRVRMALLVAGAILAVGLAWIGGRRLWAKFGPSVRSVAAQAEAAVVPPAATAQAESTAPSAAAPTTPAPNAPGSAHTAAPAAVQPARRAPARVNRAATAASPASAAATVTAPASPALPNERPMEQVIVPMSTGLVSPPVQERAARTLQTFDATNRDVVPPRVRYPQSLDLLPLGARTEAVAIEVVVNEGGTVEGAKVVRPPVTLGEYSSVMNGLSVAKTWRFQPATFNGQPVKYRLLISLTGR